MDIEENIAMAVSPETCRMLEKDCRDCVSSNASIIAMLCPTMDAAGAQQMFFRMYRSPGCGGMARAFVREYLGAVEPEFPEMAPASQPLYEIAACA